MASMAKTPKKPGKAKPAAAKSWAARLKELRAARKLTQEQAAALAQLPVRTWISWENSHRLPSSANVRILKITFPELS